MDKAKLVCSQVLIFAHYVCQITSNSRSRLELGCTLGVAVGSLRVGPVLLARTLGAAGPLAVLLVHQSCGRGRQRGQAGLLGLACHRAVQLLQRGEVLCTSSKPIRKVNAYGKPAHPGRFMHRLQPREKAPQSTDLGQGHW